VSFYFATLRSIARFVIRDRFFFWSGPGRSRGAGIGSSPLILVTLIVASSRPSSARIVVSRTRGGVVTAYAFPVEFALVIGSPR
jgi:hypothetical protein